MAAELSGETLADVRVGVSVSESQELGRLGLREAHLKLALGEIARVVIRAGGFLVYGGHLQPDGYTAFLVSELDRYGREDRPIELVLGWSEHQALTNDELLAHRRALGLKGRFTYLDPAGARINPAGPATETHTHAADSLSSLRRVLTEVTDARVFLGGKESGYEGRMPGIVEEALLGIEAGQPLYLVGGFGGATASLVEVAFDLPERFPPRDDPGDLDDAALEEVRQMIEATDWSVTQNGLSLEDNLRLATSHRPSEIATLVAIGLSRRFGAE